MKTKKLINGLLIGSLVVSASYVQATNTTTEKGTNLMSQEQTAKSDKAVKSAQNEQNALLETVNQGVLDGYKKVLNATQLLAQEGKEKEAIKILQEATGKFDVALAANPKLKLVPIDAGVSVSALITTPTLVKAETEAAIDLLKDHKVQAARTLLDPMVDEMVISKAYLPMVTYPDAIKLATKYLVEGKKEDAIDTLETTLSTIVINKSIVPLAIIRADSLLKDASNLDKNKDKAKAQELLDAAHEQLEIATLLGYTDKESKAYEDMKSQIKAVKKEIDGKNAVEKMYDKVKASIQDLIAKEKTSSK
ncbi:MAG: YfdX family protein [Methylococcaceae bacterium]|nr:YfdX family protein [Methylococcaceae bacterium]